MDDGRGSRRRTQLIVSAKRYHIGGRVDAVEIKYGHDSSPKWPLYAYCNTKQLITAFRERGRERDPIHKEQSFTPIACLLSLLFKSPSFPDRKSTLTQFHLRKEARSRMSAKNISPTEVCNINVGVMGHVDSGKTSLGFILHCIIHI